MSDIFSQLDDLYNPEITDPNNYVEEWRGHNLGLSQAIFLIDEELGRLAALQGPPGDAK